MDHATVSRLLRYLNPSDAQLLLSFIVWPREFPDERAIVAYLQGGQGIGTPSDQHELEQGDLQSAALSQTPRGR